MRNASMVLGEPWCLPRGFGRYHFGERRTIVPIVSAMRSGSTLLKALLAEGGETSRLPETRYSHYRHVTRYGAYHRICRLSPDHRILVLKMPSQYVVPFPASFLTAKIVLLTRNIFDTCKSLHAMHARKGTDASRRTPEALVRYWHDCYAERLAYLDETDHDVRHVRYEDLLEEPVRVTAELFRYVGAPRTEGTDRYGKPTSYRWAWGKDDGGDKIKSLQVQKPPERETTDLDRAIEVLVAGSDELQRLMTRLGYAPTKRDRVRDLSTAALSYPADPTTAASSATR
jgi:hypothetical protein